jgi:hypothetical protein
VGIWRSIKGLGAVYLQASVCVLPKSLEHERQLKLLQNKIVEAGGFAAVLETAAMDAQQEAAVIQRFRADREAECQEFLGKCNDYLGELRHETQTRHFTLAELQENDEDLKKLKGWLDEDQGAGVLWHAGGGGRAAPAKRLYRGAGRLRGTRV